MASLKSVADLLIREIGSFIHTSMFREAVNIREPINEEFVVKFLSTFVDTFDEQTDKDIAEGLMSRATKNGAQVMDLLLVVNRDYYEVKDDNRTRENLLALLVCFTNFSVIPMDLALYTSDFWLPVQIEE